MSTRRDICDSYERDRSISNEMRKSYGLSFQEIYNIFQPKIQRYLTQFVDEHEAEDLSQEVFIKVNKGLDKFRGESALSTWIYRIAANIALDRLRNSSSRKIDRISISNEVALKDLQVNENELSVEEYLIRKQMNSCIRNIVDKLPDNYRAIIMLSEFGKLKNYEIARYLGISLDTVKIRLHRARAKLRKELRNNCSFYRDSQNRFACELKSNPS